MIKKAKISSALVSLLLLLAFSSTILPLDLLHHHRSVAATCKNENGSCQHKFHLSEKPVNCWICAVHYDKVFTTSYPAEKILLTGSLTTYQVAPEKNYFTRLISTSLRGPPLG